MTAAFVCGLALVACGQPAGAGAEAAAQGEGGEAAFVSACVERYVAQNAQARQWAPDQCAQEWAMVVAAGPMAEAILAGARGTMPTPGRLGADVAVAVASREATFRWEERGAMIPYNVVAALAERGAAPALIGCAQVGSGEFTRAYRVAPEGAAAFQLTVYERTAPTANASSFYVVIANYSGAVQTLAQLRRDGMEWVAQECGY